MRRDHHGRVPVETVLAHLWVGVVRGREFFLPDRPLVELEAGCGLNRSPFTRLSIEPSYGSVLGLRVHDRRIGRVDADVEAVAAPRVLPICVADPLTIERVRGTAPTPVVLESATDPIRILVIESDLVELRDRKVVVEPPAFGTVERNRNAAVATQEHVVRVAGVDPQRVVVEMYVLCSFVGKGPPAVVGAHEILPPHVDSLRIVGIDPDLAEVHRPWIRGGDLLPAVAPVGGGVHARLPTSGLHRGEDEVAVPPVDVEADPSQLSVGEAVLKACPAHTAVQRAVDAAPRAGAVETPCRAPARVHGGEEYIWVQRVHDEVDRPGIVIQIQDQLPAVTPIGRFVDPSFGVVPPEVAHGRNVSDVGVAGVGLDAGDMPGFRESFVSPRGPAVHRQEHAFPPR